MSAVAAFGLALAALTAGPLLLLGFYVVADRFDWPIAGRILNTFAVALTVQFIIGALVNIVLGIALAGLALWTLQHFASAWRLPGAAAIMVLGLWRVRRGTAILWGG